MYDRKLLCQRCKNLNLSGRLYTIPSPCLQENEMVYRYYKRIQTWTQFNILKDYVFFLKATTLYSGGIRSHDP
jgi:hypothetical protein